MIKNSSLKQSSGESPLYYQRTCMKESLQKLSQMQVVMSNRQCIFSTFNNQETLTEFRLFLRNYFLKVVCTFCLCISVSFLSHYKPASSPVSQCWRPQGAETSLPFQKLNPPQGLFPHPFKSDVPHPFYSLRTAPDSLEVQNYYFLRFRSNSMSRRYCAL